MFRVDRATFNEILEKISPFMPTSKSLPRDGRQPVTKKLKLLATLRYLAGGMKWDICFGLKIGYGSFFADNENGIIWPTLMAIDEAYSIGMDFSKENCEKLASEFADINVASSEIFDGVILAIDGWVMVTRQPYASEVDKINAYRNRKGVWGIVVLAGCDARGKFHLFNAMNSGSTNDCTAWDRCRLKEIIDNGALPPQFYFIGDEAFSCTPQFLSPWGGQGIGKAKDSFNFHLSVRRQVIERAFGILTRRWGIFWRPVCANFDKWALIATAAAKLHNVCIDKNVPVVARHPSNVQQGDIEQTFVNITHEEDDNRPIRANAYNADRRKRMTDDLNVSGIRRPAYAADNSRA
jgi:hypothetical protein